MFYHPLWFFPLIFSPFPFIPFHYFLYSPNEWDHIMFVLLRLTHFTQHNTLQFHPHRSKWWVFVVSNGWGIFHCIHKPHLLYPFVFRWTPRLLPVWLLWTLLLETPGCRCLSVSLHLNLWGKSPTVQLLGRRAGIFLTVWGTSTQFSRVAAPVHIPTKRGSLGGSVV